MSAGFPVDGRRYTTLVGNVDQVYNSSGEAVFGDADDAEVRDEMLRLISHVTINSEYKHIFVERVVTKKTFKQLAIDFRLPGPAYAFRRYKRVKKILQKVYRKQNNEE